MDPDACFDDMITFVMNGEFAEAREKLRELEEWNQRGGFPPVDPRAERGNLPPQPPGIGWKEQGRG
jgi:hypothetical protein